MKIRQVNTDNADRASARAFFCSLMKMYSVQGAVLDMFARNGELTVASYVEDIGCQVDMWELSPEHEAALKNFPHRDIQIGCSYQAMMETQHRYSMVVVDTPQGVHRDWLNAEHVEHFDVVKHMSRMLDDKSLVVLYVNRSPYDKNEVGSHGYDEYEEYDFAKWMTAREKFYRTALPQHLTEEQALSAYRQVFARQGLMVKSVLTMPCFSDVEGKPPYAFRLALELERMDGFA